MDGRVPEPGPGEVLLKVLEAGVCGTDLHLHVGDFGPTLAAVADSSVVKAVLVP